MKVRNIFALIILGVAASCNTDVETQHESVPIRLTSSISSTRGIQETVLANNQKVYVWAFEEETAGTTDWSTNPYLKAWTLTSNGSNGFTHTSKYYPGKPLSMVAIHGNFTYTEGDDAYPTTVSHTVESNQNTDDNYEKSDLLWWVGNNKTQTSSAINLIFTHVLSKVEVTLSSENYTTAELSKAVVKLNNVKPTATLTLSDGSVSASGTATTVIAKNAGNATFEAVIPPQDAPANFITVSLNGQDISSAASVSSYVSGQKYLYNVQVRNMLYPLPLEYIATGNIKYITQTNSKWTIDSDNSTNTSAYFVWSNFRTLFPRGSLCDDGNTYHAGSLGEWLSICPSNTSWQGSGDRSNTWEGEKTETGLEVGGVTGLSYKSYWYKVSSTSSSADFIGIRYISSTDTRYCSAWRYILGSGQATIKARRLSTPVTSISQVSNTSNAIWTEVKSNAFWSSSDVVTRIFPCCGYQGTGSSNLNPPGTNISNRPGTGLYLINSKQTGTDHDYSTYYDELIFETTYATTFSGGFSNPSGARSVRLFRDELY